MHAAARNIVPYDSLPVPILMLLEAKNETKKGMSDIRRNNDQELAQLVTPAGGKSRSITDARLIFLEGMCETTISFSTQVTGLT